MTDAMTFLRQIAETGMPKDAAVFADYIDENPDDFPVPFDTAALRTLGVVRGPARETIKSRLRAWATSSIYRLAERRERLAAEYAAANAEAERLAARPWEDMPGDVADQCCEAADAEFPASPTPDGKAWMAAFDRAAAARGWTGGGACRCPDVRGKWGHLAHCGYRRQVG